MLGTGITAKAAIAPPPPDCNTPNPTGGAGIIETPANLNSSSQQYLTKTGTGYSSAGGAYTFTVTSIRPPGTTYTQFTDCAYSTITGNPATADYSHQQQNPAFSFDGSCSCWRLNFSESINNQSNGQPDSICDRVQIIGTDGSSGQAFTDYSNLVASTSTGQQSLAGTATSCPPTTVVPEAPFTAMLALAGTGAVGAFLWRGRRIRAARRA